LLATGSSSSPPISARPKRPPGVSSVHEVAPIRMQATPHAPGTRLRARHTRAATGMAWSTRPTRVSR